MKPVVLAIFLCVALSALNHAAQRKIAYEHRDDIFVADVDGTHQKKIATGALPEISPDGTRVAFNTSEDSKTRPGPERHIAVADVVSGKVTVLKTRRNGLETANQSFVTISTTFTRLIWTETF